MEAEYLHDTKCVEYQYVLIFHGNITVNMIIQHIKCELLLNIHTMKLDIKLIYYV